MFGIINMYEFLNTAVCGLVIGIAGVIPGLSGAVIAVSLGIYPRLISAVVNLRKDFKKNILFLVLFGVCALVGMFLFGVVMKSLLENFERSIIWLFMGLIIGSIPSFMKEATQKGFRKTYILSLAAFFIIGMLITNLAEHKLSIGVPLPVMLFAGGAILAIGAIVPGLSSSFLLMQMGMYDKIISSFVEFRLTDMLWVGLGAVLFFLATVKLINSAFEKLHGYAHFAAFGFLLATIVGVFPHLEHFTDIILFVLGALAIYFFDKVTKKKKQAIE